MQMILDNVIVNKVFKNDIKFTENLDGHRTYLQNNDEIAIMIHLVNEDITEELMTAMQVGCEFTYFAYGQRPVNMYILAENCKMCTNEHEMPSEAVFTIKMAVMQ